MIKRYSNRKLYDTKDSRYVTLLQIADMVRAGEDVQIIDNASKEDKTDVTLALIISEELKTKPRGIPLTTLKALIRNRGEKLLTTLREGPIGRLMPKDQVPASAAEPGQIVVEQVPAEPQENGEDMSETKDAKGLTRVIQTSRATLEQWQAAIDERINTVLPDFSPLKDLKNQLSKLNERLDRIEARLDGVEASSGAKAGAGSDLSGAAENKPQE